MWFLKAVFPPAWLCPCVYLPSVQPAGPVLSRHRLMYTGAPDWQAAAPRRHQEPPEVLLHGQWDERCHDARTLLLAGQQWRQQRQQPETFQIHPATTEPTSELHPQQLQDLLAWNRRGGRIQTPPLNVLFELSGGYRSHPLQSVIQLHVHLHTQVTEHVLRLSGGESAQSDQTTPTCWGSSLSSLSFGSLTACFSVPQSLDKLARDFAFLRRWKAFNKHGHIVHATPRHHGLGVRSKLWTALWGGGLHTLWWMVIMWLHFISFSSFTVNNFWKTTHHVDRLLRGLFLFRLHLKSPALK